jgi:MFS transporter, DHA1 family, tetracycline resistance protein
LIAARGHSPVLLMALVVFVDFTGFGIIIPLLPFWAQHLGANPVQVGLILTSYSLAQFLFLPVLGHLSDRYGRRPIIFWSLLIEAISFALTALAGSLPLLLLARFIGGLGAANLGSAQAVVSDTTTPQDRAHGMGIIGAAIGLGFVVGPALGGGLAAMGSTAPFWSAAALTLVNAALVFRLLPETHPVSARSSEIGHHWAPFVGLATRKHPPAILRLLEINLLYTLAFAAMEAMFPLFSEHTFGWKATQNAYIFVYVGVIMVIMQGGLVGRLAKRWGVHAVLLAGLVLLAAGLLLLPLGTRLTMLLWATGLLSAGSGMVAAAGSTLASLATPGTTQGQTLSLIQSAGGLARIIGPVAAGALYTLAGAGAPFEVGGLLICLAVVVALPMFPVAGAVGGSLPLARLTPDRPLPSPAAAVPSASSRRGRPTSVSSGVVTRSASIRRAHRRAVAPRARTFDR